MASSKAGSLRILVIGAHPADIFDQSGGTMAHHTARGDWVGCVVLTHGARVHDKVISDQMFHQKSVPDADTLTRLMAERSDLKSQEVGRACEILGVRDVFFFGEDDAVLLPNESNVRALAKMIRKLRPNVVITHFPKEDGNIGSPHATAGEITMLAISLAASVDPGDTNPPHRIAQVYYFGNGAASVRANLWSSEGGYYNDTFVDISDVAHLKLAAIDQLESQGYNGAYARKRIETNDGAFGNAAGVGYAEGFISLMSNVGYYLPLTDFQLELSQQSDHQNIARRSFRIDPDRPTPSRKAQPVSSGV